MGGGGGRGEVKGRVRSLLKTGAESGSLVLKATGFFISLLEKMTYSMICNSFHTFHYEIIREQVQNERIPMVICSRF